MASLTIAAGFVVKHSQQHFVVVADGEGTRLFDFASANEISLRNERHLKPKDLLDDGPSGSRPEDQKPRQTNEATFAKQLALAFYRMHHAGEFAALILIADPQTLGQVREVLHKSVTAAIIRSMSKDLTNHSIEQISQALQ